jgi:hypothetical protein
MSDNVKITLKGYAAFEARIKGMPDALRVNLKATLTKYILQAREMAADATNPKSGKLASSIQGYVIAQTSAVTAGLRSEGVEYAAIQERGGTIDAHEIFPAKGAALAFMWGKGGGSVGDTNFYAHVEWPGATLKPKRYILGTLRATRVEFEAAVREAMAMSAAGEGV